MNAWDIKYKIFGISKPRFRQLCGVWQCIAEKGGYLRGAPGRTPREAWRMYGFFFLGWAPPDEADYVAEQRSMTDAARGQITYSKEFLHESDKPLAL